MLKGSIVARDSNLRVDFYYPPEKLSRSHKLDFEEEKIDSGNYKLKVNGVKVSSLDLQDVYFYDNENNISSKLDDLLDLFFGQVIVQYYDGQRVNADLIITSVDIQEERRRQDKVLMAKVNITLKEV